MTDESDVQPWDRLETSIDLADGNAIQALLDDLGPTDTSLAVSRLNDDHRIALMELLSAENAADMLRELPDEQAADLIEEISAEAAAEIVDLMPADEQADILSEVHSPEAEAILEAMPDDDAGAARQLMAYPPDTAGGLMSLDFLAFPEGTTVDAVVSDMRNNAKTYSDYEVQYSYVTDSLSRIVGVLRMRDLLLAPGDKSIRDLMIVDPVRVQTSAPLEALIELYEEHAAFLGVPVTDEQDRLVGILRRQAVNEASGERAEQSYLKTSGIIGGEEFRSMPLINRAVRRLTWLAPNIVLNIIAASVIALYQDTLQAVIALAVFLPIISDMSGCSGNQAVAVSIRELSLGLIKPTEFMRVFVKEAGLGLMNGMILGLLLGTAAALWQQNVYLGLVVGCSLMLNTFIAVLLGGSVPLLLKRLRVDPALASGPILTTVTDMCGFFLVLSLATLALQRL